MSKSSRRSSSSSRARARGRGKGRASRRITTTRRRNVKRAQSHRQRLVQSGG